MAQELNEAEDRIIDLEMQLRMSRDCTAELRTEVARLEALAEKYRLEMIRCGKGWEDEIAHALKAVADEPEYPGEAPPILCAVLNQAMENKNLDLLLHAMRQTVRLTKQGIAGRIKSIRSV